MKVSNLYGMSYFFEPKEKGQLNTSNYNTITAGGTYNDCTVAFFSGVVPSTDELYEILLDDNTKTKLEQIEELSYDLVMSSQLNFKFTYDYTNNKMSVKKTPVDAIEITPVTSGTISWCMIVFNSTTKDPIIFTSDLGEWGQQDKAVIVDSLDVVSGETTTLKDISIVVQDTPTN